MSCSGKRKPHLITHNFCQTHRNRVTNLTQRLPPRSTNVVIVREGLNQFCFMNGHISQRTVGETDHVLSARNAMRSGLDRLAWTIVIASRVTRIFFRAINEHMITEVVIAFRVRQFPNSVCNGHAAINFFGPVPYKPKIVAQPNDEYTLATLRDTIINRVNQLVLNVIF